MKEKNKKIQTKDIIIIILSSVLLMSTKVFNFSHYFGGLYVSLSAYSLGGIVAMLPTWIIEILITTSVICGFKKEKASWLSYLSWGFLVIASINFVLHLFGLYVSSQLPPLFNL